MKLAIQQIPANLITHRSLNRTTLHRELTFPTTTAPSYKGITRRTRTRMTRLQTLVLTLQISVG